MAWEDGKCTEGSYATWQDVYRFWFFPFFFFAFLWNWNWELERGMLRGERKKGLFISSAAISNWWHGDSDTGNNSKGACGLPPSNCFQGFRCDNGKGKRDGPTQQLLNINANIVRAQSRNRVLQGVSVTLSNVGYCSCLCTQQHLKRNALHRGIKPNPNAAACPNPEQKTVERLGWSWEKFARNACG